MLGSLGGTVSVYDVANLPTSDEAGPTADGTCSIGILMYVLLVNVCSCRGTQIRFETAKHLPCEALCNFLWLEEQSQWS